GYQYFDQREPFMYRLVPTLVGQMGDAFPELKKNPGRVAEIIRAEEKDFLLTIQRGLKYYGEVVQTVKTAGQKLIPGTAVADLHTTHGFPKDLTQQMAQEDGLEVDLI